MSPPWAIWQYGPEIVASTWHARLTPLPRSDGGKISPAGARPHSVKTDTKNGLDGSAKRIKNMTASFSPNADRRTAASTAYERPPSFSRLGGRPTRLDASTTQIVNAATMSHTSLKRAASKAVTIARPPARPRSAVLPLLRPLSSATFCLVAATIRRPCRPLPFCQSPLPSADKSLVASRRRLIAA